MKRFALRVSLVVIMALTACQASPSTSPSPSQPSPSNAPPSAASVSEAPSQFAVIVCDPGVCVGPLAAGGYVFETTESRVEFALDEHDWLGLADTRGSGLGLVLSDMPYAAINMVAFRGGTFADTCDPSTGTVQLDVDATPAAVLDVLTTRLGVTWDGRTDVEIAGRPALQMDLTTTPNATCVDWDFVMGDGVSARVIAVDSGNETVVLLAEAVTDEVGDEYDHFIEHFTELTETMTITPLPGGA